MPPTWTGSTWQQVCNVCFDGDEERMLQHAREYARADARDVPTHLHLGKEFREIVGARNRQQWWSTAVEILTERAKADRGPVALDTMGVYLYDTEGARLGSMEWTPLPLYKGMKMTIHSYAEEFRVIRWELHHGHPDEESGLRVVLARTGRLFQAVPVHPPSPTGD